ncbi:hypothetical protein [Candidatus Palauibacter sp.]|uniref:hypothetical protein n=1 Tax=Candidatus Palauibacter sp. TaxID=3101350 RepID=UPI003B5A3205
MKHENLTDTALSSGGSTRGIVPGGTALGDFLYPAPAERRVWAIIGWWEKRRLPCNLIVAATGIVTISVGSLIMGLNGEFLPFIWLRAALVWAIMANVCYTLGPIAEIALQKLFVRRLLPAGAPCSSGPA